MTKAEKKEIKHAEKSEAGETPHPARSVNPFADMDRWFEGYVPRGWLRPFGMHWPTWEQMTASLEQHVPKMDVVDREQDIVVRAELPGVEKDQVQVSVTDNTVTIKGETKREKKATKGNYHRSEIARGAFLRTVTLPFSVVTDAVKAKFENGVLELTLPKVEKSKRRSVKIE